MQKLELVYKSCGPVGGFIVGVKTDPSVNIKSLIKRRLCPI